MTDEEKRDLVMDNRNALLQSFANNHAIPKVNKIAKRIAEFLEREFPNEAQGAVALALQLTTDNLLFGMIDEA